MEVLGIDNVVGVPTSTYPENLSKYESDEYTKVGTVKEVDLEAIKSADPDLIIIGGRQADYYDQLSEIAPTISVSKDNADYVGSVKENVNTIAELFEVEEKASEELKKAGARRCIPLNVSGPFHSEMLKNAGQDLGRVLENIEIHEIKTPYITNVTAEYVKDKNEVKNLLERQVYSSVLWQQSVEKMIRDGVKIFIEIGPGKTLNGFLKKIDRTVTGMNIERVEDLEKVTAALQQEECLC